jgi:cardiolipin synthase
MMAGSTRRRGRNHAGAPAATAPRRGLLALGLLLAAAPALGQPLPDANPYQQRNVPAEATAENAVVARDRALAAGQRLAYERMAGQLGLSRGVSDSQIEGLVSSLVIESERITPRGYSGRITVNFNPARVGGGSAPATAGAAPPPGAAPAPARGPAVATLEAVARYATFPEWVEINRRLSASPAIARVEIVSVAGDAARLRLGLRSQPPEAATELAGSGLLLGPTVPTPMDARSGDGWRLTLAGSADPPPDAPGETAGAEAVFTLPNAITFARLCAVPGAVWLMLQHRLDLAFWVFVAAGVSDGLDGWLARVRNARSRLGAVLDPVADKALLVSVYVTLAAIGVLPDWLAILVVFRDVLIVGGVLVLTILHQPPHIRPLLISKANTVLQIALAAAALLLAGYGHGDSMIIDLLIWLTAAATLASGAAYVVQAARRAA